MTTGWRIGMGQFIYQNELGPSIKGRINIEFRKGNPIIICDKIRNAFQPF